MAGGHPCCCVETCTVCSGATPTALQLDLDSNAGIALVFDPGGAGSPQVRSNGNCEDQYHLTADYVGRFGIDGDPGVFSIFAPTAPCGIAYQFDPVLTTDFCLESWSWNGSMWVMNDHFKNQKYARVEIWRAVDGHIYRKWSSSFEFPGWSVMAAPEDCGTDPIDCCEAWLATPVSGSPYYLNDLTAGALTVTPICE